ncbi:MAG: hypothetical protein ACYTF6_07945 [Planctomycetota bacterium]|jgi:hypothetical protein
MAALAGAFRPGLGGGDGRSAPAFRPGDSLVFFEQALALLVGAAGVANYRLSGGKAPPEAMAQLPPIP